MKKLVLILSALLLCLGMAYAEDAEVWEPEIYTEGIYEYIYVAYGVKITRINFGDELPKALVLPSELGEEGDPLLGIGDNVFNTFEYHYDECIQYIIIPEGVKYLSENAFMCCHNATVVFFPSTLEVIPEGAFHHFGGEIVLHADNPYFSNHLGFLVDERTSTLLYASPSADYHDIPAVRRLGDGSLQNWEAPDGDVIIPEGVEEIGEAALCDSFYRTISLPESLRKIEYLGLYCMVDYPVTLPEGCTDIGEDALPMLNEEPWFD